MSSGIWGHSSSSSLVVFLVFVFHCNSCRDENRAEATEGGQHGLRMILPSIQENQVIFIIIL